MRMLPIMFEFVTPHGLFRTQIHALRGTLPGVLDGLPASIHDARIATRRIRELLPLLGDVRRRRHIEDLQDRFKRLGRLLGRVRDADVRIGLLATLETRMPHAAPALVVLKQQREQERLHLLRKLVKKLERLDALRLIEMLDEHRIVFPGGIAWGVRAARRWRRDVRRSVYERARAAEEAIDHATGVYFPRRVHTARIAIKKLRYAMEIAHATHVGDGSDAIRELKKAQDVLGDLHDRQELVDNLLERATDREEEASQIALLKQAIDAECHDLHSRYLSRRASLHEICRAHAIRQRHPAVATLLSAGAVAITSRLSSRLR